jgi:hypothetical protein
MVGCATTPASRQGACNLAAQVSTVIIVPGNVSTQTIAFVTNRRNVEDETDPTHRHMDLAPAVAMDCVPNPAQQGRPVTCTAQLSTLPSEGGTPSGLIRFLEGDTTLASVKLSGRGTAAFTTSALTAGPHPIVASYGGDELLRSAPDGEPLGRWLH